MAKGSKMGTLEHLKIGNEVYAPDVSYRPYNYGVIISETPKMWIVKTGVNYEGKDITNRVRKSDGHGMGTLGTGRFSGMFSLSWYPMTQEVKQRKELNEKIVVIRSKFSKLVDRDKTTINSENVLQVEKLIDELLRLTTKPTNLRGE